MTLLQQLVSGVAICGGTEPLIDGPGDASLGCRQVFLEQHGSSGWIDPIGRGLFVSCAGVGWWIAEAHSTHTMGYQKMSMLCQGK